MTIDERKKASKEYVYIKYEKQWKGMDVYEEVLKTELEERRAGIVPEEDFGGGPVFLLVDSDGEVRVAKDLIEKVEIGRAIGRLV